MLFWFNFSGQTTCAFARRPGEDTRLRRVLGSPPPVRHQALGLVSFTFSSTLVLCDISSSSHVCDPLLMVMVLSQVLSLPI